MDLRIRLSLFWPRRHRRNPPPSASFPEAAANRAAFIAGAGRILLLRAWQAAEEGSFASAEAAVRNISPSTQLRRTHITSWGHLLPRSSCERILERVHLRRETSKAHSDGAEEIVALDYVLLGAFIDADRWLTKSLSWEPANALGWYYLGRARYNENRFAEAIDALKLLETRTRNVKAEDNIGLSQEGLNHPDEAAKAFQTAISWQDGATEKNAQPFLNLAVFLRIRGMPRKAYLTC